MKRLRAPISVVAVGLILVGLAHADPNQPGPDLRYGGGLINFQPELTISNQFGKADVYGWNVETIDLEIEPPPIDYRNGSEDVSARKESGLKKYTNIRLQRPRRSEPR